MAKSKRSFLTKIMSRLPQTLYLKPDTYIHVRDLQDHSLYWDIFTGPEYMIFLPLLSQIQPDAPLRLIDCGAANGLFTLWVHHMAKIGVLPWQLAHYVAVEPSDYQLTALKRNLATNLPTSQYTIYEGLVGSKTGSVPFHQATRGNKRLGSSYRVEKEGASVHERPFIDLSEQLRHPNILKLDIEGGEFDFVDAYADDLGQVQALIIEWHLEMGDVEASRAALQAQGLRLAKNSLDGDTRQVELYLREAGT